MVNEQGIDQIKIDKSKIESFTNNKISEVIRKEDTEEKSNDFNKYLNKLKINLPGVEDKTFKWKNVVSFLIIELSSTDCLKDSVRLTPGDKNGKSSNIQITSGKHGKKINFFPLLEIDDVFSSRRLRVQARMSNKNIKELDNSYNIEAGWLPGTIQVWNRGTLNDGKNPVIHICYDGDLTEVRKRLGKNDYLVIVKQKNNNIYEAFGVLKEKVNLGSHKEIYIRNDIVYGKSRESTVHNMSEITTKSYIRVLDLMQLQDEMIFDKTDYDQNYLIGDEIWALNSQSKLITHQLKIININEKTVTVTVLKRIPQRLSQRLFKNIDNLPTTLREYFKDSKFVVNEGE